MSNTPIQQQGSAPQTQGQQQGQTATKLQQSAGTPAPAPVIRDWAAI